MIKKFFIAAVLMIAGLSTAIAARHVKMIMEDLSTHHGVLARALKKGSYDESSKTEIQTLFTLYSELEESYRSVYGGENSSWKEFCEKSKSAVKNVDASWQAGDIQSARDSFKELKKIQDEAHAQFRPNFLSKLKKLFSKK